MVVTFSDVVEEGTSVTVTVTVVGAQDPVSTIAASVVTEPFSSVTVTKVVIVEVEVVGKELASEEASAEEVIAEEAGAEEAGAEEAGAEVSYAASGASVV